MTSATGFMNIIIKTIIRVQPADGGCGQKCQLDVSLSIVNGQDQQPQLLCL